MSVRAISTLSLSISTHKVDYKAQQKACFVACEPERWPALQKEFFFTASSRKYSVDMAFLSACGMRTTFPYETVR